MQHYGDKLNQKLTDEARHTYATAARPTLTDEARAQSLAQAMLAAIKDGRNDQARALAIELKPLMGFLPEGK